jgi:hypothetical protein
MSWLRRISAVGLVLLLTVGVSCTSSDTAPTEAPAIASSDSASQSSPGFGLIGDLTGAVVGPLGNVTDLLTCSAQPYESTTETIGPKGGVISVGSHSLVIPKGALSSDVTITAEQMSGKTNSVRFNPEGLQFQKPAVLTMSYRNCVVVLLQKKIVFTTEKLKILEVLSSLDLFKSKTVTAPIDHFSRYAVAY